MKNACHKKECSKNRIVFVKYLLSKCFDTRLILIQCDQYYKNYFTMPIFSGRKLITPCISLITSCY